MSTLTSSGALPRWFPVPGIRFELPEGAEGGAAVADPEPVEPEENPVDPEGEVPVDPEPQEPAAPIDWNLPENRAALDEVTGQHLAPIFEAFAQQPEAELPAPPDQFSENYEAELEAWQTAREQRLLDQVRSEIGPISEYVQQAQTERINTQVNSIVDETVAEHKIAAEDRGVFEALANGYAGQVQGEGEAAVREATASAAKALTEFKSKTEEAAVQRYKDDIAGINRGRAEPGIGGAALGTEETPSSYEEHTRRFLARQNIPYA